MEAFMYRFHPLTERAGRLVASSSARCHCRASFKFALSDREDIRLDPNCPIQLMDVGFSAVSAARGFLGEPDRAFAHSRDSRDSGGHEPQRRPLVRRRTGRLDFLWATGRDGSPTGSRPTAAGSKRTPLRPDHDRPSR